jgi:hypothetical protein
MHKGMGKMKQKAAASFFVPEEGIFPQGYDHWQSIL